MDISFLRERAKDSYTVAELNNYIKNLLDYDKTLSAVSVTGEISNLTDHRSGHLYFSLKDADAQIKAVMFRSQRSRLKFVPEDGMLVTVRGSVSVYPQGGTVQFYVNTMTPDGTGELYKAYEQLKNKLFNEGLFDEIHKKPIPRFPTKIGVITSPSGAAVQDIINITGRRFPLTQIYLYPSLVQGSGAEENLIKALDYFDKTRFVDLLIIGRGGGSIEDLWAFNGERLARKIYDCDIPIISAVGHETDFTICDFVSDLRAPTPSAAAELAVPDAKDLLLGLEDAEVRLSALLNRVIERKREMLGRMRDKRIFTDPKELFLHLYREIEEKKLYAEKYILQKHTENASNLRYIAGKIDALSPLSVLSRGYAVAENEKGVIKSVDDLILDEDIKLTFANGVALATVKSKKIKKKNAKKGTRNE